MQCKFTQIAEDFKDGVYKSDETWSVKTIDIARITESRNSFASKVLALEAKVESLEIELMQNKPNRFATYG